MQPRPCCVFLVKLNQITQYPGRPFIMVQSPPIRGGFVPKASLATGRQSVPPSVFGSLSRAVISIIPIPLRYLTWHD